MNNISQQSKILNKLKNRYATKIFDKDFQLSERFTNFILEVINIAPSSFGLQPFRVILIEDLRLRKKIKKVAWNQKQIIDSSFIVIFAIETDQHKALLRHASNLKKIRGDNKKKTQKYIEFINNFVAERSIANKKFYEEWASRQAYIALGYVLSICALINIDTCPIEGFEADRLDALLNLQQYGVNAKVMVCIGKKSKLDKRIIRPKVRKDLDQLMIHLDKIP